jgi:hypothetical protein
MWSGFRDPLPIGAKAQTLAQTLPVDVQGEAEDATPEAPARKEEPFERQAAP